MKKILGLLIVLVSAQAALAVGPRCLIYDEYFSDTTPAARKVLSERGYDVVKEFPSGKVYFSIIKDHHMERSPVADIACLSGDDNFITTTKIRLGFVDGLYYDVGKASTWHIECDSSDDARIKEKRNASLLSIVSSIPNCAKALEKRATILAN